MSDLPTIHPLSETPLGRGPAGECLCNWCRHWSPLLAHVSSELSPQRLALLNEYGQYVDNRLLDGNVAEAKFDGSWLGWEWMQAASGVDPYREGHEVDERDDSPDVAAQKRVVVRELLKLAALIAKGDDEPLE